MSIKGELLPLLVREQFMKRDSDLKASYKPSAVEELNQSFEPSKGPFKGLFLCHESSHRKITCRSHMIKQGFCVRANNVTSYLEANKLVAQNPVLWSVTPASKIRGVNDCVIGEEYTIGDKSTVKRCVVGKKSTIGSKVKLQDSVLMQKSVVEDG